MAARSSRLPRPPARVWSLRSRREHTHANRQLARMFHERGARTAVVRLHEGPVTTRYLPDLDIWLGAHRLANRYRNAFGPGDPVGRRNLWPSIQLNLAFAPGGARPHARFLRDDRDQIWVAHTGQLGGRQPGITRAGFLALLGGAQPVAIEHGTEPAVIEDLVLLGTFADPAPLLVAIARLTHTADNYRSALAAGLTLQP